MFLALGVVVKWQCSKCNKWARAICLPYHLISVNSCLFYTFLIQIKWSENFVTDGWDNVFLRIFSLVLLLIVMFFSLQICRAFLQTSLVLRARMGILIMTVDVSRVGCTVATLSGGAWRNSAAGGVLLLGQGLLGLGPLVVKEKIVNSQF